MRETPYLRSIPRQLPWVLGLAIVMAVTGPFGLYGSVSLGVRLVYFGTTAVLIWLQVLGFAVLLSQVEAIAALVDRGAHGAGRRAGSHTGHHRDHRSE